MQPKNATRSRSPRRVIRLAAGLAVVTFVATPRVLTAQLTATPKALDFGEQGHMARQTGEIVLTNHGAKPVSVAEIHPSCGCIEVSPPALVEAVKPGASVRLKVTMSGGRAMGILAKKVEIRPAVGTPISIPVRMKVLHEFRMEPREIRFDGVVGGPPLTKEIRVERFDGGDFRLEAVSVRPRQRGSRESSPHFRLSTSRAKRGRLLRVTLLPTHPEGRIWGDLEARVDGRRLVVPLSGEMFRGIKIVPHYFNFNRIVPTDPASHLEEAVLTSTDGRPFEVLQVTPSFQDRPGQTVELTVEPRASLERNEWTLRARIVPAPGRVSLPADGHLSGTVRVLTDHPEKEEILLRFFGFFATSR